MLYPYARSPSSAANPVWRLLSHPCSPEAAWQAESGQLLVDKRARGGMNLVALEIARAMMEEEAFWFRLSGTPTNKGRLQKLTV